MSSAALSPWLSNVEPDQTNIRAFMDNLMAKNQPMEQTRWLQSNIDSLFYVGCQQFVNQYYNYAPNTAQQQFYFNFIQQCVNMVTGYSRQHRKSMLYTPTDGSNSKTTDQYTRLIMNQMHNLHLDEQLDKAKELSAISGMVLCQPYLDFQKGDPAQGDLGMKIWEYNSFIVDPFFRESDMSDCQYVWCQEYISREEAYERFGEKGLQVAPLQGSPQTYGRFYFLPENNSLYRNNLYVTSYIWYKWKSKVDKLYSPTLHRYFEIPKNGSFDPQLFTIPDLRVESVTEPVWKLAVVLNDQLVWQGENPLGIRGKCPLVPVFWNYSPEINQYDYRVRSLVRCMRDSNYLFNRRVILNHMISEGNVNSGWKRKIGAVANEDNLRKTNGSYDIVINDGFELSDIEKIVPNAVPASDMELAEQLRQMIFSVSGIDMENWAGQDDKQISSVTALIKQAANLTVLQKYFDQWDMAQSLIGGLFVDIVINNWNEYKVAEIINEKPTEQFFSPSFARYKVLVEEGLNTPTQKTMQARQMMDINQMFGREVFGPSKIVPLLNISGKDEVVKDLMEQEQMMQQQQQHSQMLQHTIEDAKLKELYAKTANLIASAQERHGRNQSNVGLFQERLSEVQKNDALSIKAKAEAVEKLIEVISKYGELEAYLGQKGVANMEFSQDRKEEIDKMDAQRTSEGNRFVAQILAGMSQQAQGQ